MVEIPTFLTQFTTKSAGTFGVVDRAATQWGHGFKAVETLGVERARVYQLLPQWGHGFEAVETAPAAGEAAVNRHAAAMGPRIQAVETGA